jgi:hypothetical protein
MGGATPRPVPKHLPPHRRALPVLTSMPPRRSAAWTEVRALLVAGAIEPSGEGSVCSGSGHRTEVRWPSPALAIPAASRPRQRPLPPRPGRNPFATPGLAAEPSGDACKRSGHGVRRSAPASGACRAARAVTAPKRGSGSETLRCTRSRATPKRRPCPGPAVQTSRGRHHAGARLGSETRGAGWAASAPKRGPGPGPAVQLGPPPCRSTGRTEACEAALATAAPERRWRPRLALQLGLSPRRSAGRVRGLQCSSCPGHAEARPRRRGLRSQGVPGRRRAEARFESETRGAGGPPPRRSADPVRVLRCHSGRLRTEARGGPRPAVQTLWATATPKRGRGPRPAHGSSHCRAGARIVRSRSAVQGQAVAVPKHGSGPGPAKQLGPLPRRSAGRVRGLCCRAFRRRAEARVGSGSCGAGRAVAMPEHGSGPEPAVHRAGRASAETPVGSGSCDHRASRSAAAPKRGEARDLLTARLTAAPERGS